MVKWKIQSHVLCLLASVVILVLIPVTSIQVSASTLAPSLLLNTLSLLRDVYICDLRISFLFIPKSICPEPVSRFHQTRYVSVSPLSEISGGLWKLSLFDKVRFLKPPWISSIVYAFSRQWDEISIFRFCVMRIVIITKITGGREVNQCCLCRCFLYDYDWGKFGLQFFFQRCYAVDLVYKIGLNQPYGVVWMAIHEPSPSYLKNGFGFGSMGMTLRTWISVKWDYGYRYPTTHTYLGQQLRKRGYFGMNEDTIVTERKRFDMLISQKIKTKSNSHRKTRSRRYHDDHREYLPELPSTLIPERRQVPESFPTTFNFIPLKKVMPRAFWSLSYKLLANKKCVKEGHNRLYLLARKAFDSRVTLHFFIEIVIISCICVNGRFVMIMYLVNTL